MSRGPHPWLLPLLLAFLLPPPPPPSSPMASAAPIIANGYFSGGDALFVPTSTSSFAGSFSFFPLSVSSAPNPGDLNLLGNLTLRGNPGLGVALVLHGSWSALTGELSMVGSGVVVARSNQGSFEDAKETRIKDSTDCEIVINVQYTPLNAEAGEKLKGAINCRGDKSDPFFFYSLEMAPYDIYTSQAVESG